MSALELYAEWRAAADRYRRQARYAQRKVMAEVFERRAAEYDRSAYALAAEIRSGRAR